MHSFLRTRARARTCPYVLPLRGLTPQPLQHAYALARTHISLPASPGDRLVVVVGLDVGVGTGAGVIALLRTEYACGSAQPPRIYSHSTTHTIHTRVSPRARMCSFSFPLLSYFTSSHTLTPTPHTQTNTHTRTGACPAGMQQPGPRSGA